MTYQKKEKVIDKWGKEERSPMIAECWPQREGEAPSGKGRDLRTDKQRRRPITKSDPSRTRYHFEVRQYNLIVRGG